MLKSIRLKNFKLHEDTKVEAAPITVFIGPNNSGKSSIFQALLALRQAAERASRNLFEPTARQSTSEQAPYLFPANQVLDIGEFRDAVRRGEDEIRLEIAGSVRDRGTFSKSLPIEIASAMEVRENQLTLHQGEIRYGENSLKWFWIASYAQPAQSSMAARDGTTMQFETVENFRLIRSSGSAMPTGLPVGDAGPEWARVSDRIAASPLRMMQSFHPVYPLRGFEESGYPLPKERPDNVTRQTLRDRALALVGTLAYDRKAREELSRRLKDLIRIEMSVDPVPGYGVKIWVTSTESGSEEILLTNEGTGANQLPFIFLPVLLAPPNETILLSEPEAHLHPKAQCDLTRMLLTIAKKENIQFFFETHSEHVLHVILNAVAKGEWTRDQVALIYFQNKNGVADVSRRDINQFGQVDGGLPDFFEQSLAELTEYLKALSKT
jgi:hypothetical protein